MTNYQPRSQPFWFLILFPIQFVTMDLFEILFLYTLPVKSSSAKSDDENFSRRIFSPTNYFYRRIFFADENFKIVTIILAVDRKF